MVWLQRVWKIEFNGDVTMTGVFCTNSSFFLVKLQNASDSNFTMTCWLWCLVFLFTGRRYNPRVIANFNYSFVYILIWHRIRNTADLCVVSPTVLYKFGLTFFKSYIPCFLIHSARTLTIQIFTWKHQVCNKVR